MKLNRRSVLGAIGMIGVGTGAAFGSGAFTTVEAQREVEVNVLGGEDGIELLNPDDDDQGNLDQEIEDREDEIANNIAGNFADVLVDTSSSNIAVSAGDTTYSGSQLFPVFSDTYDSVDNEYVSLVANDVTVVFGPSGNELPTNSTLTQNNLFALVSTGNFDVAFTSENATNARLLTQIGGSDVGDTGSASSATGTVDNDTTLLNATVDTGETATETEDLTIEITEN